LLTEARGIPISCVMEKANRNDFKILEETILNIVAKRPSASAKKPQGMCLDKGYDYREVRETLTRFNFIPHIRCRGEEARKIKKEKGFKARRWVVERTHSWMNRFRDILICWTKKAINFQAQIDLVCAYITLGQCDLLG
jgi:putative transposase